MIDFLKAHPSVSKDEYLWCWTVPQIHLAICDNTHVEYLTEEQAKLENARRHGSIIKGAKSEEALNDLGIPIFG